MKLKYYLRGLGIGIIVTTIILMICFSRQKGSVSDEEVMQRAAQLGMIMPEEDGIVEENSEIDETERQAENSNQSEIKMTESEPETDQTENQETTEEEEAEDTAASEEVLTESGQEQENITGEAPLDEANEQGDNSSSYRLQIQPGDVCRTVCDTLAANGIIDDSEALRKYLLEIGYSSYIREGEYDIPYGLSMEEVAQVLMAGPIK